MRMSTYERWCWYFCYHISTHDLTRRSIYSSFLSTFKCTVFQLTTSQGGRQRVGAFLLWIFQISTHDLARRSTLVTIYRSSFPIFQLTTSQGGRPGRWTDYPCGKYFNSRPRKEVDERSEREAALEEIFQLTTSQGGRPTDISKFF